MVLLLLSYGMSFGLDEEKLVTDQQTACAIIELGLCLGVFRHSTAAAFRAANHSEEHQDGNMKRAIAQPPYARITWICSFFFLGYMGVEVATGGWIVTYMMEVRGGEAFASGMTATGFWLGISCGRMVLGFVTPLLTEEFAVIVSSPVLWYITLNSSLLQSFGLIP